MRSHSTVPPPGAVGGVKRKPSSLSRNTNGRRAQYPALGCTLGGNHGTPQGGPLGDVTALGAAALLAPESCASCQMLVLDCRSRLPVRKSNTAIVENARSVGTSSAGAPLRTGLPPPRRNCAHAGGAGHTSSRCPPELTWGASASCTVFPGTTPNDSTPVTCPLGSTCSRLTNAPAVAADMCCASKSLHGQ